MLNGNVTLNEWKVFTHWFGSRNYCNYRSCKTCYRLLSYFIETI